MLLRVRKLVPELCQKPTLELLHPRALSNNSHGARIQSNFSRTSYCSSAKAAGLRGGVTSRHRSSGAKCLSRLSLVWYAGLRAAV